MLGVTFGGKHSHSDYGLLLKGYPAISPPVPKTKYVDVLGADGALDLSKALTGYIQFNRRTITMEFNIMAPREEWPAKHSEIMNALHGEEMQIVLDDDPDYSYTGRLSVEGYDPQKVTSGVKITADVEPYKVKAATKTFRITVEESAQARITVNMPVIPTITCTSSDVIMRFGGSSCLLKAGTNTYSTVVLRRGENAFTFTGSGTVKFEYKEGGF